MEYTKLIKVVPLLVIMFYLTIHNAIPHVHLQHGHAGAELASGAGHNHDHVQHDHYDHHHHGQDESEEPSGLLDILLVNHIHTQLIHKAPADIESQPKSISCQQPFAYAPPVIQPGHSKLSGLHRYALHKPIVRSQHSTRPPLLRGPPSLV